MKQFAEYHSHTFYSDGKMTMEDLVNAARYVGLEKIGISDHGYKHMGFGVKYKDYDKMKSEIERLREKYKDIDILFGVEANILDEYGNIDIDDKIYNLVDYVMAGYHFGSKPSSFRTIRNHTFNYIKSLKHVEVEYNTKAIINTIKNNKIIAITHPGDKGRILTREVALTAAKYGVALEISNHHNNLSYEQLMEIKDIEDLRYIVGADAHKKEDIGNLGKAFKNIERANISVSSIINCR
ncbi:MAG: PHP domain-containing protein [Filifactoraceae bacterium]